MQSAIQINQVSVKYGPVTALSDICLEIEEGECVLVTGPSGCGKSTLARLLSGLIPHAVRAQFDGEVHIGSLDTRSHTIPELARKVGMVFQNPSSQLFHLLVEDEVAFGPRNLDLTEEEVQLRVNWALEAVGAEELRDHNPAELSGGQKQIVAIAAALAMKPSILVLDEPTASLDVTGASCVVGTLQKMRQELGITIVIVEHRLAEVTQLVERVIILDEGRVAADGTVSEVLGDRGLLRRYGLRRPVDSAPKPWDELLKPNGSPPTDLPPLLTINQLSAGYKENLVLHDVDLTLYPGEFVALVGENGAGKSTLALVISGLLKPKSGSFSFNGRKPQVGLDVSLLFQNPSDQLFTDVVDEEIAYGPRNYRCFNQESHETLLNKADLMAIRARQPISLSAGQQQRTTLAACLSLTPKMVILDEPTLGQDWGHLQQLMDFLTTLNESGVTILLITHDFKLVHHYAQRVVLMEAGRIIMDGRPQRGKERMF